MMYTLSTDQELPCFWQMPSHVSTLSQDKLWKVDETIHAIRCTETKFKEIRDLTEADDTLQRLALTITEGWPESAKDLRKDMRSFWSCRDSFSLEDGNHHERRQDLHSTANERGSTREDTHWPPRNNQVPGLCTNLRCTGRAWTRMLKQCADHVHSANHTRDSNRGNL